MVPGNVPAAARIREPASCGKGIKPVIFFQDAAFLYLFQSAGISFPGFHHRQQDRGGQGTGPPIEEIDK